MFGDAVGKEIGGREGPRGTIVMCVHVQRELVVRAIRVARFRFSSGVAMLNGTAV